jgi:hypothetical protein
MIQRLFAWTRPLVVASLVCLPALGMLGCEKEPENKIESGLKEAAEGVKEGTQEAAKETGEAVEEAGQEIQDAADNK